MVAFLVAYSQLEGEKESSVFNVISLRAKVIRTPSKKQCTSHKRSSAISIGRIRKLKCKHIFLFVIQRWIVHCDDLPAKRQIHFFKNIIFHLTYFPTITKKIFPLVFLLLTATLYLVKLNKSLWITLFSFYVSWFYLRFYQKTGNTRGDESDSFGFVNLFPSALKPLLAPICNSCYLLASKILPKRNAAATSLPTDNAFLVTESDPEAAERVKRHRARAVEALNERLAKLEEVEKVEKVKTQDK